MIILSQLNKVEIIINARLNKVLSYFSLSNNC